MAGYQKVRPPTLVDALVGAIPVTEKGAAGGVALFDVRAHASHTLSGYYNNGQGTATTRFLGTRRAHTAPFRVDRMCVIDRVGVDITGAGDGSSVIRLGLYRHLASPTASSFAELVADFGTVDGTVTGLALLNISQPLIPGLYWFVCAEQGDRVQAPTVRAVNNSGDPAVHQQLVGNFGADGSASGHTGNNGTMTGALPATIGSSDGCILYAIPAAPRFVVRFA